MRSSTSLLVYLIVSICIAISATSLGTFVVLDRVLSRLAEERINEQLVTRLMVLTMEMDRLDTHNEAGQIALLQHSGLAHGIEGALFQMLDGDGEILASSESRFWPSLADKVPPQATREAYHMVFQDLATPAKRARLLYYRLSDTQMLRVGMDISDDLQARAQSRWMIFVGWLVALIAAILSILLITSRAVTSLRRVSGTANAIQDRDQLHERVQLPTGFLETDEMAVTFNRMMDRIQKLVENQKMVMDHFAHDLKTPITRLRGFGEKAARQQNEAQLSGHVVEECDRMIDMLNMVLEITRTKAGLYHSDPQPFDFSACVAEGITLFEPSLEAKGLVLRAEVCESIMVVGEERTLQRVVANLLENAFKYTDEGFIAVRLFIDRGFTVLEVSDSGIGIKAADRQHIFTPFFRADGGGEGHGLGLAFCRTAVEASGGSIHYATNENGFGSCFTVRLPQPISPG